MPPAGWGKETSGRSLDPKSFALEHHGRGPGVGRSRGVARGLGVGVGLGGTAQYLVPVFRPPPCPPPPKMIISLPVQTAVCEARAEGALEVLVAIQLSVLGLYLPPVFK